MTVGRAPLTPRRALAFACAATTACMLAIATLEGLAQFVPAAVGWIGVAIAGVFLGLPLLLERAGLSWGDPYGLGPGRAGRALLTGLIASVVVLVPFALGYDVVATRLWGEQRFAGPGWLSRGASFQGAPTGQAAVPGFVEIFEHGDGLQLRNGRDVTIVVDPQCQGAGCTPQQIAAGSVAVLRDPAARAFILKNVAGEVVDSNAIRLGRYGAAPDNDVLGHSRGLLWWIWLLLDQIVVIALPEELLFRGWMLGMLRVALPPRRRVLGVPFGQAHIVSALLFAVVHLAAVPEAHRLLVFFPGLLFAWLAERSRHVGAAVIHHALANAALTALSRIYA
jgi:hypothetical protein